MQIIDYAKRSVIKRFFPYKLSAERNYYHGTYPPEPNQPILSDYILYMIGIDAIKKDDKLLNLVVDYGCGCGYGSKLIANSLDCKVIGIDYSKEAIRYAKRHNNHPLVKYLQADLNGSFSSIDADYAFFIETIEHLKKPFRALEKINKSTGRFVFISTPKEPENCKIYSWHISPFTPHLVAELKLKFTITDLGLLRLFNDLDSDTIFTDDISDYVVHDEELGSNYLWLVY
tara:strand:- start:161 stop:850 length:690 start_codon:yes stop_codon:yes gene_type:complete